MAHAIQCVIAVVGGHASVVGLHFVNTCRSVVIPIDIGGDALAWQCQVEALLGSSDGDLLLHIKF